MKFYTIGFALSLLLTMAAFLFIQIHFIIICAILQIFVQLFFFLHVGRKEKPRWNLTVLVFACIIVGILVGGTLWIMGNVQHNTMPQNTYLND
ncbi:MAG: cytochrome C oxidase subunit IV family protein [bacterium]|nr:cytochrome C oxidase subunit IV family protein [bacterium]